MQIHQEKVKHSIGKKSEINGSEKSWFNSYKLGK